MCGATNINKRKRRNLSIKPTVITYKRIDYIFYIKNILTIVEISLLGKKFPVWLRWAAKQGFVFWVVCGLFII
jgi:hypothetical protein